VKHLIATLAVGFSMALVALGAVNPAGAAGKPSYGCPPGFIGPLTLQQYLDLPRNQAGFAAGAYDVESRTSAFNEIDNSNHDGMICAKDVAASVGSGATPIWQYFYDIVDNDASVPTR
jgi:hypothetical protein